MKNVILSGSDKHSAGLGAKGRDCANLMPACQEMEDDLRTKEVPCPNVDAALERMRTEGWNLAEYLKAAEDDGDDVRRERNSDEDLQELSDVEELLPCGCCLCGSPLFETDSVHTGKGMAHEECAEKEWPFDPYRDLGIPRGEL